ncbi:MAG: beta-lactamase family protein [Rhizobacter sp.]|nr:beta-lactamase family protein [Ferruginibacter sp.]
MMKIQWPVFFVCLFFYNIEGKGQELTDVQKKQLDAIATQDVPPGAPGIATGIVANGMIVYKKYAGFADLTDSTLISEQSRFNIASNGKQFTAFAILVLEAEKKLKLGDGVKKYLPGLFPSIKANITLKQLLTHTSGIRDVYDLCSLQGITWWKQSYNNADALALISRQQQLNFAPGSQYLYSNSNYILLSMVVEKVTGKSFVDYTNGLFKKLNMPHTSFENDYSRIRGPIARAYFNFDSWTTFKWKWNVYGDGNIFSTLADQLQWEILLQQKKTSTLWKAVLEKSQELPGKTIFKDYGYGLEFGNYKGLKYAFHEGATGAWKATVIRFPEKNISIVTLTNTGKSIPAMQTRQMADVMLQLSNDEKYFITRPERPGTFVKEEDVTGTYLTGNGFIFQFKRSDSFLYLQRSGRNDIKLEREAANIFHQVNDTDFKQEFKKNTKGEMEVTAYYVSHAPYTLTRAKTNWSGFDYRRICGIYINEETNAACSISYSANKNYEIIKNGKDTARGTLISPEKLLIDNYILKFDNSTSLAASFLLDAERIKNVKFLKVNQSPGLPDTTKVSVNDFEPFRGNWTGSLTYLDYSSGEPYTMPANITVNLLKEQGTIVLIKSYPDEPNANVVDTLNISADGKKINDVPVQSVKYFKNGDTEIITLREGTDGNDHKPASIQVSYTAGNNHFTIRKEVKFKGQTQWLQRHEYKFTSEK